MLSNVQKNVIIRALQIRETHGEDLKKAILDYKKLTSEDKEQILLVFSPSASRE